MKLQRALNAFKKNGIEVTHVDRWGTGNFTYLAKFGKEVLEFHENGKGSGEVTIFWSRHPDTNSSVDLFMDSHFDSIKSAVHFLKSSG